MLPLGLRQALFPLHRGSIGVRVGLGLLGVLILIVGVGAVLMSANAAGATSLLGLGALFVGASVFANRIESLEFGAAKIHLAQVASERSDLAAQKEVAGDSEGSARLRKQSFALRRLAGTYERLRTSLPRGAERTRVLDSIMHQAMELAREAEFEPSDVWRWFDRGAPDSRVIALGLMEGDARLADIFCALEAIERPSSLFEQYYGMRVARRLVPKLSELEREWLRTAVTRARQGRKFRSDPPLMLLSDELLRATE